MFYHRKQSAPMVAAESIRASRKITDDQIQPASLDLRLGAIAYRVRASFLAGSDNKVADRLPRFQMHAVDLTQGAVLEKRLCLSGAFAGKPTSAEKYQRGYQCQELHWSRGFIHPLHHRLWRGI